MGLTKEQLEHWRHVEGKTNVEIANMTGRSVATINGLFCKYKIPQRERTIPRETVAAICQMKLSGSSIKEIAEAVKYSEATVKNYLKAAGLTEPRNKEEQEMFDLVQAKKPKIFPVVIKGKQYLDITELWL